jgi:hypothetical protein
MRWRGALLLILISITVLAGGLSVMKSVAATHSHVPKNGFVPDKETAIRVAEAILVPIYGEKQVAAERPFSADLKGDVWIVSGHLPEGWVGGVAEVSISKRTCEIISVSHGK